MNKRPPKERLGDMLMSGFKEIEQMLQQKKRPEQVFTVREVRIVSPPAFAPRDVKSLRRSLRVSTAVFAGVVGVSSKLIEQWESGLRTPSPMACRLLDAIRRDPASFLHQAISSPAA